MAARWGRGLGGGSGVGGEARDHHLFGAQHALAPEETALEDLLHGLVLGGLLGGLHLHGAVQLAIEERFALHGHDVAAVQQLQELVHQVLEAVGDDLGGDLLPDQAGLEPAQAVVEEQEVEQQGFFGLEDEVFLVLRELFVELVEGLLLDLALCVALVHGQSDRVEGVRELPQGLVAAVSPAAAFLGGWQGRLLEGCRA